MRRSYIITSTLLLQLTMDLEYLALCRLRLSFPVEDLSELYRLPLAIERNPHINFDDRVWKKLSYTKIDIYMFKFCFYLCCKKEIHQKLNIESYRRN